MRRRDPDAGLSLIELMVAMVVGTIAVGFVFAIYTRSSVAYQTQARVSELQQTLRAANDLLARDIRQAGYLFGEVRYNDAGGNIATFRAFSVDNDAEEEHSDTFRIGMADTSLSTRVTLPPPGNPFSSAQTKVDSVAGFAEGDVVVAVRAGNPGRNRGCVLMITGINDGPNPMLQHNQGGGEPWNSAGNNQCDDICGEGAGEGCWDDGATLFARFSSRSYRILPGDTRGVLQVSPSGGAIADDWQDLAIGVVDMQVEMRVYQDEDEDDADGDGDPERDWISDDGMEAALDAAGTELIAVRLSLVARTTAEVDGATLTNSPASGDHEGVELPTDDAGSRYYGNHYYRQVSTVIDLRNLGIGRGF